MNSRRQILLTFRNGLDHEVRAVAQIRVRAEKHRAETQCQQCRAELLIGEQLRLLGYRYRVAADGEQALREWLAKPTDIVITDCNLPQMSGFELAQRGLGALTNLLHAGFLHRQPRFQAVQHGQQAVGKGL